MHDGRAERWRQMILVIHTEAVSERQHMYSCCTHNLLVEMIGNELQIYG